MQGRMPVDVRDPSQQNEVAGFFLKPDAPVTFHEIFERMDSLFLFYLRSQERGQNAHFARKVRKAFDANGFTATSFLRKAFAHDPEIEKFDSSDALSPADIRNLLVRLSQFGQVILDGNPEIRAFSRSPENDTSRLGAAGLEFFGRKNGIRTDEMYLIEAFFVNYLFAAFFEKSEERENQDEAASRDWHLTSFFRKVLEVFGYVCEAQGADEPIKASILESLLSVYSARKNIAPEAFAGFFEGMERFVQETGMDLANLDSATEYAPLLAELVRTHFPTYWVETVVKVRARTLMLGDRENPQNRMFAVVHSQNFFFDRSGDTEPHPDDVFPPSANIIYSHADRLMGYKDLSVFDVSGKKVFWGDIGLNDVSRIRGTYFVLARRDSIGSDIPSFATVAQALRPATDPFGEGLRRELYDEGYQPDIANDIPYMDPDYVRFKALGKIRDGAFFPNFREIRLENE